MFFEILLITVGGITVLLAWPAMIGLHQPTTLQLWVVKVMSSAVSPILFVLAIIIFVFGLLISSILLMSIGGLSTILYSIHIFQITRPAQLFSGFEQAFGSQWKERIAPSTKKHFLKKRYSILFPKSATAHIDQDITFYSIHGENRDLLCDVWQPPLYVSRSGLAFIYLHGSAWAVLDKDFGTRKFFNHLANQGHVIMDVAYRLYPETDMMGMVYDAKHAIDWMKKNASKYQVDPDKIVIGGGSAGAHIALLAGYAPKKEQLTPSDLIDADLSVKAIISLYGQSDLTSTYYHTAQHLVQESSLSGENVESMPAWIKNKMGKNFHRLGFDKKVEPGMLRPMFGGDPEEKPEGYDLFSPIKYVNKNCPATLIIHGKQDILAPVKAIQYLYYRLKEEHVPVVMHLIPQTDHAFDLIFPKFSPSAHNAIHDVERFLAVMAVSKSKLAVKKTELLIESTSELLP